MTGTPGTGKTTVSTILSERLRARHIELSKFSIENGYVIEDDVERDTKVVDMEALGSAIGEIIEKSSSRVIVDGHYAHELVDGPLISRLLVLRRKPWNLKSVLEARHYSNEKVWENLEAEIMGVIIGEALELIPGSKIFEIDTSNQTSGETADQIIEIIEGNASSKPILDWVTYPETMELLLSRSCTS
ncbi:AAA family ATPase [Candidatus Bathyarchaeota archaeon]|nr:AAA family ATPase [Candidatus Bathyarchaeota archaeon]